MALKQLARRVLDSLANRIAARIHKAGAGLNFDERALVLLGRILREKLRVRSDVGSLADVEFKVFSQWGEDGIIQYLVERLRIENKTFVEFGVQDYTESNTRFLLLKDSWSGLVIDGSERDIGRIRADPLYWRHDLDAVCAFVTRDNINDLITRRFVAEELGLLSIDIDGNDYWIWQAIDCVRPRVVVCEYNSVFGCRFAVTVPYRADFDRTAAHHSNLYYGASLAALCRLADEKGYALVGSNSAGNNAFFVRKDRLEGLGALSAVQAYVESRYRESRDTSGALSYLAGLQRLRVIRDLPLVDLASGTTRPIREIFADELSAAR